MKPLEGIRVVDFGHVWAGPYAAATLADLGADVVKIESPKRLDVHRRQGPYPEGEAGINRSGVWNAQNRNKKSIALDLSDPDQRAHAIRLVRESHVVIENFSPGVMKKLGLDYATLREIKPDIVMASLSAFGQKGPQSRYVGYGPSLDAWSGVCSLNAYPNHPPLALGGMFPDTASALYAAFAIMAALRRRESTGEGTYIDLSELEVSALLVADLLVEYPGEDVPPQWVGNADPYMRVQGTYPCKGEDAWIMISIDDDSAWRGLCEVLGGEPKGDVDAAVTRWTQQRTPDQAFKELQAHDVPAGAGLTIAQLLEDEQLASRDFFRVVRHPEVGEQTIYAPIWRFDGEPGETRPAPLLGQDTGAVLAALHEIR